MSEKVKQTRFNSDMAQCFFSKMLAFTLGPIELKKMIDNDDCIVVDVRTREDYDIAHIPTAISIPKSEMTNNFDKLSKDKVNIIYSYNKYCHLGACACLTLSEYGYPVMLLEGGYKTWHDDFKFD